jgi:signal transduction histidine kinase
VSLFERFQNQLSYLKDVSAESAMVAVKSFFKEDLKAANIFAVSVGPNTRPEDLPKVSRIYELAQHRQSLDFFVQGQSGYARLAERNTDIVYWFPVSIENKGTQWLVVEDCPINLSGSDYLLGLGRFAGLISGLLERVEVRDRELEQMRTFAQLSSLARQVAHDIRSPLAALDVGLSDLGELPENKRILVRTAVNRIKDIANNLLNQNKAESLVNSLEMTSITTNSARNTNVLPAAQYSQNF